MCIVQGVIEKLGMRWFHPDDTLVIARHEGMPLDVSFRAAPPGLVIQRYRGTIEEFAGVCTAVESEVTGLTAIANFTNL
jgi:hypothetical protein